MFCSRYFSYKSMKRSIFPVIWNESPLSIYHMLPIRVIVMNVMRVKSISDYEAKDSLVASITGSFLLAFFYGHFMA